MKLSIDLQECKVFSKKLISLNYNKKVLMHNKTGYYHNICGFTLTSLRDFLVNI